MADVITDEDLLRWQGIAQSRIDTKTAADEVACAIIVRLCEKLLEERHNRKKPVFENLMHQGDSCFPPVPITKQGKLL